MLLGLWFVSELHVLIGLEYYSENKVKDFRTSQVIRNEIEFFFKHDV
jgi:hypothetical protein